MSANAAKPTVLVTTCDGYTGSAVANHLIEQGPDRFQRILLGCTGDSDPHTHLHPEVADRAEICHVKLDDPQSIADVLNGVDSLALIPPARGDRFDAGVAWMRAAERAGVKNCVLVSWAGVHAIASAPSEYPQLSAMKRLEEEFVSNCALANKCVLRAGLYAQTLLAYARPAVRDGVLPLPIGAAKLALLDTEILARAVAVILASPVMLSTYRLQVLTLTGRELLGGVKLAECVQRAIGSKVEFRGDVSLDEARDQLATAKPALDKAEIDAILETYRLARESKLESVSSDLHSILDLKHPSLAEVLERETDTFKKLAQA